VTQKCLGFLEQAIREVQPGAADGRALSREMTLDALGLSSLKTIRLVTHIEERLKIHLDEEDLVTAETLGDFCEIVEAALAKGPRG